MNLERELIAALRPFVESYRKAADEVGDSDLYGDQPRSVLVTLAECRTAEHVLWKATNEHAQS